VTDLSRMKKHVGILGTTGVRCMVVFRKVPGDESHCLIVETDHLSDMYHDNIIEICNSRESQEALELHEVLNRRTFGDGLNALQALHYKGFLRKVPVSQVTLLPFPNQKLPLELLNAQLDGKMDDYNNKAAEVKQAEINKQRADNPMSDPSDPKAIAKGLLVQADMLESEAKRKRAEALSLDPSLAPATTKTSTTKTSTTKKAATPVVEDDKKGRGRPKLSAAEKAERLEERKRKRLERDRANAAKKKTDKETSELKKAVDAKVVRDSKRSEQEA